MASAGESSDVSSLRLFVSASSEDTGLRLSLAAIGILLIFRITLAATSNLAEDEAYYWLWSTHLAAGYYDHPPMIAYWIGAGTSLFGQTAFGVRFAGLAATLAGSYLLYLTSLTLFRNRLAALTAVLWLNATLLFNAAAIVATPDTPLAFFTTLVLFALAKLMDTRRGTWWYAIGAALGLAFMSKYTAVLLLPGVLLWMVALPEGRRWFGRAEPYLGALIALVLIAPVFYWNYAHDWVSFAKQAGHGIKDKPASALSSVAELLGGQAGLATPIIFAFCLFGSFYALLRGWRRRDPRWLLLGTMTAPLFAFFFIHAVEQKIQANWPGLVYPAAILAAVHSFFALAKEREIPKWVRSGFHLAPWVGMAFTLAAFLQLGLGVVPIESKKDPTSRLKGWAKLGADIEALERSQGAAGTLTDRYAITAELAFYRSLQHPVLQTGERIRYANLPAPDEAKLKQSPALFIVRKGGDASGAAAFFETSRFLQTLVREGGLHPRDAYDVYLMAGYRGGLFAQAGAPGR